MVKKCSHSAIDDEDDKYEKALQSLVAPATYVYDSYIQGLYCRIDELDYWHDASKQEFPQRSRMVPRILAVPATGAGVEHEFSLSVELLLRLEADSLLKPYQAS